MLRRNSDASASDFNPAPMAEPPALNLDPREIWNIIRRRWRIVIAFPVAFVIAAVIYVATTPKLYTATSTVLADPRRANMIEANQQAMTNFGIDDATIDSQALLVQSHAGLRAVVEQLNLTDDREFNPPPSFIGSAIGRIRSLFQGSRPATGLSADQLALTRTVVTLQRNVSVARQARTFLLNVNATSEDPVKASKIANALADAYFKAQVRAKNDAVRIAGDWLNSQIEEMKSRVVASDRAVEEFRIANDLIAAKGVTVNDQQLSDLNNKLIEARVQSAEAKAKLDQVKRMSSAGGDPGAFDSAISSDTIIRLRAQYAEIAKNEADLANKYGNRHPMVANVRAQLKDTQKLIDEEIRRINSSTQHEYDVARSREASLQQSLKELQEVSTTSSQAQVRLRELQREADANRTVYESYLTRYKDASARESLELPDARVVTWAAVPLAPSSPKTFLLLGIAVLLGLGAGAVFAFLADFFDRRVKTPKQAEDSSGVPTLAAVPLIGARELAGRARRGQQDLGRYDPSDPGLLPATLQPPLMRYAIEEPDSYFAEAIRSIRLAAQRSFHEHSTRTIVVTSALPGEGKTTVAVNLALSFAALGLRTLLIDCDLRNPQLTRSLSPRAEAGLIEIAMGQRSFKRAILVDPTTGLSVLPAPSSRDTATATELMFSDRMAHIFTHLRQLYEIIIVDSPPLMPLVDGRALVEYADQIVLALAWDRTPRDVIAHTLELLAPVQDRILGTVLTQVDFHRYRFYDYYRNTAYPPYAMAGSAR